MPSFSIRARRWLTPSHPSTALPRWRGWGRPRPTWCRSELGPSPDMAATVILWTSAPTCTVGTLSFLLCCLSLMVHCLSLLNEGSGLIAFTTGLIGIHYTCILSGSLIWLVVFIHVWACVLPSRWPTEVGTGPAATHHRLGLRWSGGRCCLGGYRRCLP